VRLLGRKLVELYKMLTSGEATYGALPVYIKRLE
jgi:hypothetical protein